MTGRCLEALRAAERCDSETLLCFIFGISALVRVLGTLKSRWARDAVTWSASLDAAVSMALSRADPSMSMSFQLEIARSGDRMRAILMARAPARGQLSGLLRFWAVREIMEGKPDARRFTL